MKIRVRAGFILTSCSLLGLACGDETETVSVTTRAISGGPVMFVLPPINAGCATFQPGYDPGEGDQGPTLHGEPFDVWEDDFCTSVWMYDFQAEDGTFYWDWYNYQVDVGDIDPDIGLPPHMEAIYPTARDSALYCEWRWEIVPESVEGFPESDIQRYVATLREVSYFCSDEYTPSGWVDGEDGEQWEFYLMRSTNPEIVLLLDGPVTGQPEPGVTFQGLVGLDETGGWDPRSSDPAGLTWHYRRCEPEPSADGRGIGFCRSEGEPQCRYFSAGAGREKCEWSDIQALPANPDLITESWRLEHAEIYEQVFGT
jgi:hypothetical protein